MRAAWAAGLGEVVLSLRAHRPRLRRRAHLRPDLRRGPRARRRDERPLSPAQGRGGHRRHPALRGGPRRLRRRRASASSPRSSPTRAPSPSATRDSTARCRWRTPSARSAPSGQLSSSCRARRRDAYAGVSSIAIAALTLDSLADARRRLRPGLSSARPRRRSARPSPASSTACSCAKACSSSAARRSPTCATTSFAPSATPPLAAVAAAERAAAVARVARRRRRGASPAPARRRAPPRRRAARRADSLERRSAAPVQGVVLTARPEERVDRAPRRATRSPSSAAPIRSSSSSASIERDVTRVQLGDEVRLRIAALPQQTFSGRVVSIAPSVGEHAARRSPSRPRRRREPRRAARPGMAAYARVLTEPASVLWRLASRPRARVSSRLVEILVMSRSL